MEKLLRRYNIIQVGGYLLILDDGHLKEGDWMYNDLVGPKIAISKVDDEDVAWYRISTKTWKRIIAHLPLNDSPILDGVDLLPELEQENEAICPYPESKQNAVDWHNGYNKAKEKYKYTEDDIKNALSQAFMASQEDYQITTDEIIQSLSQPNIPIAFELEMVDFEVDMGLGEECIEYSQYPKLIINSDGIKTWVGKYIH